MNRPIGMGLVAVAGTPQLTVAASDRLLGCGQTASLSVGEGIADLRAIGDAGLHGVMMPGEPGTLDTALPVFAPA